MGKIAVAIIQTLHTGRTSSVQHAGEPLYGNSFPVLESLVAQFQCLFDCDSCVGLVLCHEDSLAAGSVHQYVGFIITAMFASAHTGSNVCFESGLHMN